MASVPTVTTELGALVGLAGDGVRVWRGIPYARPPVGELRWKAPRPPALSGGVHVAAEYGPHAMQSPDPMNPSAVCDEDCLYLNVCTPEGPAPDGGWPVLFWLHGGGYRVGHGEQLGDGEEFARAGIVVVTINYRLGSLGFLHLAGIFGESEADAGVCGLLDQIEALKWVRRNVSAFGGDPARITVYGVSAGAKSLGNLMGSPLSAGLFAQGISSSGGADHVATPEAGTALARRLLDEVGCHDADALRALPAKEFIEAQERILTGLQALWLWRPTLHPRVLPEVPIEPIRRGSAAGIPLLIGCNSNEGSTYAMMLGDDVATAPASAVLNGILGEERASHLLETYLRRVPDLKSAKVAAMGDERYGIPTQRLADAQSVHAPVFRYRIDIAAPGVPEQLDGGHGTETTMAWKVPMPLFDQAIAVNPKRERAALLIHRAWVRFIRDGVADADGPEWPSYGPELRPVLVFREDTDLVLDPRPDERKAWGDTEWASGTWFPVT
ncbi:carboxylesterase/lipase family protein [Amycolatopsis lexingtonensis]|uniref:carboxylesterase/lipase family protein n=1 Tax=Amycolatopsis lexingtonensis TaxID=218822 RepID=UPI003F6ECEE1